MGPEMWWRRLSLALVAVMFLNVPDALAACHLLNRDVTTVCADGECWTRVYDTYECDYFGGGGGTGGGPGGGGGGGGSYNPYDTNADGAIDVWRGVVATDDDCANNFDENDRLGANLGGTNNTRPDHNGVDIQANYGDSVYSAFSGTVENVGVSGGCGYRIQIRNTNGTHTTYCHMVDGSSALPVGATVRAGLTKIGQADSTGSSTGDHLHVSHLDSNYNSGGEYFDSVGTPPTSGQLNSGGC